MSPDWKDFAAVAADAVARGLEEDCADRDAATAALGRSAAAPSCAVAVARSRVVLCGWMLVEKVFDSLGGEVEVTRLAEEGCALDRGARAGIIRGPAGVLLRGERTALNLLNRLSGIATLTRKFVDAVAGTGVEILDTRKTTPGLRALERYAVRCGGGVNHRFDLCEMAMFKDNHWIAAGGLVGLSDAVSAARAAGVPVEVEIDSLEQLHPVIGMHPDRILLDNMNPATVAEAVRAARGSGIYMEASGGISLETVRAMAETGVDGISTGCLTHSAPAADISLDWEAR